MPIKSAKIFSQRARRFNFIILNLYFNLYARWCFKDFVILLNIHLISFDATLYKYY